MLLFTVYVEIRKVTLWKGVSQPRPQIWNIFVEVSCSVSIVFSLEAVANESGLGAVGRKK
jgi:hypothetical protein